MTAPLTPEYLASLRKSAEHMRKHGLHLQDMRGEMTLALLDRVEALEAKWERPSHWRCDGCGAVESPDDGRRPDMHHGCGGMWVRLG